MFRLYIRRAPNVRSAFASVLLLLCSSCIAASFVYEAPASRPPETTTSAPSQTAGALGLLPLPRGFVVQQPGYRAGSLFEDDLCDKNCPAGWSEVELSLLRRLHFPSCWTARRWERRGASPTGAKVVRVVRTSRSCEGDGLLCGTGSDLDPHLPHTHDLDTNHAQRPHHACAEDAEDTRLPDRVYVGAAAPAAPSGGSALQRGKAAWQRVRAKIRSSSLRSDNPAVVPESPLRSGDSGTTAGLSERRELERIFARTRCHAALPRCNAEPPLGAAGAAAPTYTRSGRRVSSASSAHA